MSASESRIDASSSTTYTTSARSAMGRFHRQYQVKFAVRPRHRVECPAVCFGNRSAHRKPQAHATWFARHERLEQLLPARCRNARPVVGNNNANVPGIMALRAERDEPLARRAIDGLGGGLDQV